MSDSLHPCVYEDEYVSVYLEEKPYYEFFIHVDSHKWSKEIYNHYIDVFAELLNQLEDLGYTHMHAAILSDDRKLKKFASMFGFVPTGTMVKDTKERVREVYKCSI